jgi:hypothetical protein
MPSPADRSALSQGSWVRRRVGRPCRPAGATARLLLALPLVLNRRAPVAVPPQAPGQVYAATAPAPSPA